MVDPNTPNIGPRPGRVDVQDSPHTRRGQLTPWEQGSEFKSGEACRTSDRTRSRERFPRRTLDRSDLQPGVLAVAGTAGRMTAAGVVHNIR